MGQSARAVIWDLDGVIVDTEEFHFGAWHRLIVEHGGELTKASFKRTFGMRNAEIIRILFGTSIEDARLEQLAQKKESYFRQLIAHKISANPGAVELINQLRDAGFHQAVASSAPRENIELILSALGIKDAFEQIICEADVEVGKPDPQIFLLAAKRLGVEPNKAVVIEDSLAGVEAAKAGGMKCIALTSTFPAERLQLADRIIATLERLGIGDIVALLS